MLLRFPLPEILLVEDSPFDAELTLLAFDQVGLSDRVHLVRDGREALDYLSADGPYGESRGNRSPKVILLDLKMPLVDGFEVLQLIKSDPLTSHLPVVLLTSSYQERDVTKGYALGANSYIVKPVDFSDAGRVLAPPQPGSCRRRVTGRGTPRPYYLAPTPGRGAVGAWPSCWARRRRGERSPIHWAGGEAQWVARALTRPA